VQPPEFLLGGMALLLQSHLMMLSLTFWCRQSPRRRNVLDYQEEWTSFALLDTFARRERKIWLMVDVRLELTVITLALPA